MRMAIVNSNVFFTWTSEILQTWSFVLHLTNQRREKKRSQVINPLRGIVGGQAWIMPAFVISDCLRSLLSRSVLQLDYHALELSEFHQAAD